MKRTSICPGCNKDVSRIRLIDLVYTFKESDGDNRLMEIAWHKKCFIDAEAKQAEATAVARGE